MLRYALALGIVGLTALPLYAQSPESQPLTDAERARVETELNLDLSDMQYVSAPMTEDQRKAIEAQVETDARDLEKLAIRTDAALDRIVKLAAWSLRRKGHSADATRIETEYRNYYTRGVYYTYLGVEQLELGDHQPLSQWLVTWYDKLESILGPFVMKITHLCDIKILNYGIPVVFHPAGWKGEIWDIADYRDHFAGHMEPDGWMFIHHGVAGVAAYWTTWGICVGATWGAGAIVFICTPIGAASEYAMDRWAAPPLSDWVYCRANGCTDTIQQL
jgi:hypothetical protein